MVAGVMVGLRPHDYCCALSGLPFWSGDGGTYGPTIPTLGRLNNDRDCSDENIRIVCLDFNSLRGVDPTTRCIAWPRPCSGIGEVARSRPPSATQCAALIRGLLAAGASV